MLIVEENQEYSNIIGSSKASYINSLATTYASATSWFGVQHNSPNAYLDLLSGSNQGFPNSPTPYTATTLVDELHSGATVIPWQAYMESMPSTPCFKGTPPPDGLYIPGHNPYHSFKNYTTNTGGWCSNLSTEGVVAYPGASGLLTALTATNAPDFVQISPNNCDNMHGDTNSGSTCKGDTTGMLITAGDNWLLTNIDPVIKSTWFTNFNSIVIITWDEGTTNNGCCGIAAAGHIATVAVTSKNKGAFPSGFGGTGDHYGTLRSIEEAYGVPLLFNSQNLTNGDLSGAFGP
jgi:acid phosphatase